MACHHWISVWAWAGTAVAPAMARRANAEAAIVAWMRCIYLVSLDLRVMPISSRPQCLRRDGPVKLR